MNFFAVDANGKLEAIETDSNFAFDTVGTYKIYAVGANVVSAFTANMTKAAKLELLMEADSLVDGISDSVKWRRCNW